MKACLKLWSVLAIGLALVAGPLRAEVLYMANGGGNSISAYRIAENGTLTLVTGSPFPAGNAPVSVAVDVFGRFLYAANIGDNTISAYHIGEGGVLTLVAVSPAGIEPVSVAVDSLGRSVYVANLGNDFDFVTSNVSAYHIAANGALQPLAGSPFPAGFAPISVAVDPLRRFVYVGNSGGQTNAKENVSGYRIVGKGVLKPLAGSPFPNGEGPESVALDPFGRFLYVADFYDNAFSAYRIAANGALQPLAGSPFHAGPNSSSVVADPLGRFVYVANFFNTVSVYRVGQNGLTQVAGSPFQLGFFSYYISSMAVDLLGRFIYVANQGSVSAYRIGEGGALTQQVAGSPFRTGISPDSMAVSP